MTKNPSINAPSLDSSDSCKEYDAEGIIALMSEEERAEADECIRFMNHMLDEMGFDDETGTFPPSN